MLPMETPTRAHTLFMVDCVIARGFNTFHQLWQCVVLQHIAHCLLCCRRTEFQYFFSLIWMIEQCEPASLPHSIIVERIIIKLRILIWQCHRNDFGPARIFHFTKLCMNNKRISLHTLTLIFQTKRPQRLLYRCCYCCHSLSLFLVRRWFDLNTSCDGALSLMMRIIWCSVASAKNADSNRINKVIWH